MVFYEAAVTTVAAATAAAYAEFMPNGTRRCYVREIGVFAGTAVAASKTQLGRPGNTPTVGSASVGIAYDPANTTGTGGITTTWTTAPTAPTVAHKQFDFGAVIGSAVIYPYDPDAPLVVGPTRANSEILWNAGSGTGPAMSFAVKWAE